MKTITHNNHTIEISNNGLTGKEVVKYDGQVMSEKRSMMGTVHTFRVEEESQSVQYEVEIGTRWHGFSSWTTVRRSGEIIFSDK